MKFFENFNVFILIATAFLVKKSLGNFDFVGVVFDPLNVVIDGGVNRTLSFYDVKKKVEIISTRFRRLTTYTSSVIAVNNNAKPPLSALGLWISQLNSKLNQTYIGIGNPKTPEETERRLSPFLQHVNRKFSQSISGFIVRNLLDNEFEKESEVNSLLQILEMAKNVLKHLKVEIGIRAHQCQQLSNIPEILAFLNFVICFVNSNSSAPAKQEAGNVMNHLKQVRALLPPTLKFAGEAAFCSPSDFETVTFWTEMGTLGEVHNITVDFIEAFDTPRNTVEMSQCGWWARDETSPTGYIEKSDKVKRSAEANPTEVPKPPATPNSDRSSFSWDGNSEEVPKFFGTSKLVNATSTKHSFPADHETTTDKTTKINNFASKENDAEGIQIAPWALTLLGLTGVFLLSASISGFLLWRKRKQNLVVPREIGELMELDDFPPKERVYESKKPQEHDTIHSSDIDMQKAEYLGSGEFGIVYKTKIARRKGEFAVKVAYIGNMRNLLTEIKMLLKINKHPNVVSLIATCHGNILQGQIMVVMELCEKGSLADLLRKFKRENTRQQMLLVYSRKLHRRFLQWSFEISNGMKYISSKNIIHGDLATRNVLITKNNTAKITDFGFSRHLYDMKEYLKKTKEPLPVRWMAIESLKSGIFSTKSDVWGFGVTLWETFTFAATPYETLPLNVEEILKHLKSGLRLARPQFATTEIFDIMINCWHIDAESRPTFSQLASDLRRQLQRFHDYSNVPI